MIDARLRAGPAPRRVTKPSLQKLTEVSVRRAFTGGDDKSLILEELSALVISYIWGFCHHPGEMDRLRVQPLCPLEELAWNIASDALHHGAGVAAAPV